MNDRCHPSPLYRMLQASIIMVTMSTGSRSKQKSYHFQYIRSAFGLLIVCSLAMPFWVSSFFEMSNNQYLSYEQITRYLETMTAPGASENLRKTPMLASRDGVGLIWLLSFPNSGTTYTHMNVEHVTNRSAATNYGHESEDLVPLERYPEGPFLYNSKLEVHQEGLLTKTHCAGYCDACANGSFVTASEFLNGCAKTTFLKNGEKLKGSYGLSMARKVVHLIRSPVDNIVARMHRGVQKRTKLGWTSEQLEVFQDSREGMLEWCKQSVENFEQIPQDWQKYGMTVEQEELAKTIPCYPDFVRYIRFHNHAVEAIEELGLPTHYLFYEDYGTSYDKTLSELLDFLGLSAVQEPLQFEVGKSYSHLFTTNELHSIAKLVRELSSTKTWPLLRHYVTEWLVPSGTAIDATKQIKVVDTGVSNSLDSEIAWLMSFPNSGTSYTITNTFHISNASTASNYGHEAMRTSGRLVPVRRELPEGPFILYPELKRPPFMLTKTHCAGYCDACTPIDTFTTQVDFLAACRETSVGNWPNQTVSISEKYKPKKIVHIFRSPFDNLVARKHLGVKKRIRVGIFQQEPAVFGDHREGFFAWCAFIDNQFEKQKGAGKWLTFTEEAKELFRQVPCYSDFFRYIQWHNNAVETTELLDVPIHHMYYEDYTTRYDEVVQELNAFLDLPIVNEPLHFHPGKTYISFYTKDELEKVAKLFEFLAYPKTWELVKHYFDFELNKHLLHKGGASKPDIAWLMSFPNSGTSYTITNVGESTLTTTASNHGDECMQNVNIPIRADYRNGPYIHDIYRPLPEKFILTKTHCSGFCDECNQTMSTKTPHQFQVGCQTTKRKSDGGKFVLAKYQKDFPKRAIHLWRSPWDNIVSRMHLGIQVRRRRGWLEKRLVTFTDTQEGLLKWCEHVDMKFLEGEEGANFTGEAMRVFEANHIPCFSEWYRYVHWHNNAISLLKELQLTNINLFYEDYTLDYEGNVKKVLDFLEMKPVTDLKPFESGKTYGHVFSNDVKRVAAQFMKALATPECWEQLERYLGQYLEAENESSDKTKDEVQTNAANDKVDLGESEDHDLDEDTNGDERNEAADDDDDDGSSEEVDEDGGSEDETEEEIEALTS